MKNVVAALLLGIEAVFLLRAGCAAVPPLPPDHIFWAGDHGINVANSKTHRVRVYPLSAKSGGPIRNPIFTFWRHRVIYWSPPDRAFCMVRPTGTRVWIRRPGKLPHTFDVREITPYPEGIVVSGEYEATAAYRLNLLTGHTRRIPGVHEARSWSGSEALAVIDLQGNVELRSPRRIQRLLANKAEEAEWDYDFRNRRLYFIHDTGVFLVGAGGRWTNLPWPAPFVLPEGVVPVRSAHQIWVAGGGQIGINAGVILYST
ncbi:MAG: hypothetical protein M3Y56_16920, partial [Armatimonadota bacterium]|nr:hypothetical protein [Armatimonadota bacterium]